MAMRLGVFLGRGTRGRWAAPLVAALGLAFLTVSEMSYQRARDSIERADAMLAQRVEVRRLQLLLQAAEAGERGYLLTGQPEYKEPFNEARQQVETQAAQLHTLFAGDYESRADVRELEDLARRKMSELTTTVEMFEAGNARGALEMVKTGIGRDLMRALDTLVSSTAAQEEIRMAYARRGLMNALIVGRLGIAALVLLSLVLLALTLRQARRFDAAREVQRVELQRERDRLETEVERRTRDLTELARHLQIVREDERSHLARELHDELGGLLTAAKLDVARVKSRLKGAPPEVAERIGHLVASLDSGIALKRRIIEDLRPSTLSNLGLTAALEVLCGEFARRSELKIATAFDEVQLRPDVQLTAYRVVQEALTNVAKYAKARRVSVQLRDDGGQAGLRIEDDGVGFDVTHMPRVAHGLAGMRFRVVSHGGRLDIASRPGEGTLIEVSLPQAPPEPEGALPAAG